MRYLISMGRGQNKDNISIEARREIDNQPDYVVRTHQLPDGVVESFDAEHILRKVVVPDQRAWSRNGVSFMGHGGVAHFDAEDRLHNDDGPAVEYFSGRQAWWHHGERHREDGPALIDEAGVEEYWINGQLHREDGPAVIEGGVEEWHQHGQLHRLDGPAIVFPNGSELWFKEGLPHREDGPAAIAPDGSKEWRQDGQLYREDGPSLEWSDGTNEWIAGDQRHRLDGPAVENSRDPSKNEYWVNNQRFASEEEWKEAVSTYKSTLL